MGRGMTQPGDDMAAFLAQGGLASERKAELQRAATGAGSRIDQFLARHRWAALAALLGAGGLMQAALVGIILLAYRLPTGLINLYGPNNGAVQLFQEGWKWPAASTLPVGRFSTALAGLLLLLFLFYGAALVIVRRCPGSFRPLFIAAVLWMLCFHLSLALFFPPVLSTDINYYVASGRLLATHGMNPYLVPPSAMGADPIMRFPLVDIPTSYGPLWTLVGGGVEALTGARSVFGDVLAFKLLAALLSVLVAGLIYLVVARANSQRGLEAIILYAWSPLVLLELPGGGHNDVAMLLFLVVGLLLYSRRRYLLGLVALVLSFLVKWVAAIAILYYLVAWMQGLPSWKRRLQALVPAGLASAGLVVVSFLFFWRGPETLAGMMDVSGWTRLTPALILLALLEQLFRSIPATASRAGPLAASVLSLSLKGLLLLFMLWQARRLWKKGVQPGDPGPVARYWEGTILPYILLVHSAIFPWYFLWPWVTAAIPSQGRRRLPWVVAGLSVVAVLLYGLGWT